MKIGPEKFNEYMIAKEALNKMYSAIKFTNEGCYLTKTEIQALFSQKVIDLDAHRGMME